MRCNFPACRCSAAGERASRSDWGARWRTAPPRGTAVTVSWNNNCIFKECSATGNTNTGIYAINYNNCVFVTASAVGNGVGGTVDGISVDGRCRGCSSANNASNGITSGNGCMIENCTATANANGAFDSSGIICGSGCIVEHCTANINGTGEGSGKGITCNGGLISECIASGNGSFGIYSFSEVLVRNCQIQTNGTAFQLNSGILVPEGSTVSGCFVSEAVYGSNYGIYVDGNGCQVTGNTIYGGVGGILVNANNCRVDGNHILNSKNGIYIPFVVTNNVIVRNSVSGSSSLNYYVSAGNDVGPIGTAATATSPWANISH